MWAFLMWLVVGLVAGAIAKLIYPGRQGGGILGTMLLGIVGSLVGGFLGNLFFGVGDGVSGEPTIPGVVTAIVGALVVLFIWSMAVRRRVT